MRYFILNRPRRALATIAATGLAVTGLASASTPAQAAITTSISNVKLSSPLVLRDTTDLTLSATVTGAFGTDSASEVGGAWGSANGTLTCTYVDNRGVTSAPMTVNQSKVWTETATHYSEKSLTIDGVSHTPAVDGSVEYSKSINISDLADGSYTASLTASISQTKTVSTYKATEWRYKSGANSCYADSQAWTFGFDKYGAADSTSSPVKESSTSVTASKTYIVDRIAPTVSGRINPESGFVEEGQALNTTLEILGGSANSPIRYTVTAVSETNSDDDGNPITFSGSGSSQFGGSGTGIADKHAINSGAFVPCGVPLGSYVVNATVVTQDLGGFDFDPIPVSLLDGDGNVGRSIVRTASNLSASNFLVAQMADGSYGNIDAFSVAQTKKKGTTTWSSNIGTIHFAGLLTTPGRCQSDKATYSFNVKRNHLVLRAPAGFAFVKTGASPFAHTFAGFLAQGVTLNYHDGNLSGGEVTANTPETATLNGLAVGTGTQADKIEIDLSSLGTNGAEFKVYVRAKLQWVGTSSPTNGALFRFVDSVDNFNSSSPVVTASNNSSYCLTYVDSALIEHGC